VANIARQMAALIERHPQRPGWPAGAMMRAHRWVRAAMGLIVALLIGVAPDAFAQVLDDVEVSDSAEGVVVLTRFAAQVGYRRHVVSPDGDEVQVYFSITAIEASAGVGVEDTRLVPAAEGLPGVKVRYLPGAQTASLRRVDISFDAPVEVLRVGLGSDNSSLVTVVKPRRARDAAAPAAAGADSAPATPLSGDPGAALMSARQAISTGKYEDAVALLNQILNLPPNPASQDAQELIGNAREALGETTRARAEYELYLKLFPDAPGAVRVKDRLANLSTTIDSGKGGKGVSAPQTMYWGSASQSYYGGQSRIRNETTIITPGTNATVLDVQDISSNDQSSVVTQVDANARYRGNGWDDRFVFRDVMVWSLLDTQPSENRLSALYADFKNEGTRFDARIGRQSSMSGAVLGRFDGATMHYGIGPSWRAGAFAGTPAEETLGGRKRFYGFTLDNEKLLEGMGLGFYGVEQRSDGFVDRRALGSELRYFTPRVSLFSLLDYDIHFNQLNIASAQGTLSFEGGATFNMLYDYRRSPPLQLTNALLGNPTSSLQQLIDGASLEQLEREALGLTPVSRVLLLGGLYPVGTHWQVGGEIRVSSVSDTMATATLPAAPGTGNVYSYTLQAIGTGIFTPSTVVVFNGSRLSSDAYDAWLLSVNTRFRPNERWSIEPTLRYYLQDASNGATLRRLSPTLRMTYQLRDRISLESELSMERSRTHNGLVDETSNLLFYYLGYGWEF
jgi:hypothetical protein